MNCHKKGFPYTLAHYNNYIYASLHLRKSFEVIPARPRVFVLRQLSEVER